MFVKSKKLNEVTETVMPPNKIETFTDLEQLGWESFRNSKTKKLGYKRPNGKIVYQKRHLSECENAEFGHILFPGRRKAGVKETSLVDNSGQTSEEGETVSGGEGTTQSGEPRVCFYKIITHAHTHNIY